MAMLRLPYLLIFYINAHSIGITQIAEYAVFIRVSVVQEQDFKLASVHFGKVCISIVHRSVHN